MITENIIINSDDWADNGKIYKVIKYFRRSESTAVELTLEEPSGEVVQKVVPYHWIEWVDGE